MANLAEIGIVSDTSTLKDSTSDLNNFAGATDKAEKAANRTTKTLTKMEAIAERLEAAAAGLASSTDRLAAAMDREAGSTAAAIAELGTMVTISRKASSAADTQASANNKVASSYKNMANAAKAVPSAKSINDMFGIGGTGGRNRGEDIAAYGAQMDALRAKFNPLFAVLRQYKANIEEIRHANRVGAISADEMTEAIKRQRQAALAAASAARGRPGAGGSGGPGRAGRNGGNGDMYDGLNLSRQLADIGTQLGSGQNPLMILIQQGPQIADIFASAAARGSSFNAVMRALWTTLQPFLPYILAIAAAVSALIIAFALTAREINKHTGDIAKELKLTKDEMEKLKKAGVDTKVTMVDTFEALFVTIGDGLKESFGPQIKWMGDTWNAGLDAIVQYSIMTFKNIGGVTVGLVEYMVSLFKAVPKIIGEGFINGVNLAIRAVNWLSGKLEAFFNFLGLKGVKAIKYDEIVNQFAGSAANALGDASKVATAAFKQFGDGADAFGEKWAKNAEKIRKNKIKEALGDRDKKTGGGKTELEKYLDLLAGAKADIAVENARALAAGLTMTAEEAATLEYKTKLLNQAAAQDIKLTAERRAEIEALAAAFGKAKIAADDAVSLRDLFRDNDKAIQGVKDEIALIGLYGRELEYAAAKAQMLADARARGMTPAAIADAMPEIERRAGVVADVNADKSRKDFMEAQEQQYKKNTRALAQQSEIIGMNADQLLRYQYAQQAVNDAIDAHVDLLPHDIEQLRAWGLEQANAEIRARKMAEAVEFNRETARGFFSEMRDGLNEGKTLWQSFADAAVGALNKIVARLQDKAIDKLVDVLFSGGKKEKSALGEGSGFFSAQAAHGYAFNQRGIHAFASGGIVDKATAFAFGGNKLGVMGEAGPEAVLPLKRGSNGDLGVQMASGRGATAQRPNLVINNSFVQNLTGTMSSADVVAVARKAGEQAVETSKRSIQNWAQQQQEDGTVV